MLQTQNNVLISRFSHFLTRIKYICQILRCINVDTLTQDNVSCLNTALAILLFAKDKGELPAYLEALLQIQTTSATHSPAVSYFENLYQLCMFWKKHYQPSGQDVKCLVDGSGINYDRWRDCVDVLTSCNMHTPLSLCCYHPSVLSLK